MSRSRFGALILTATWLAGCSAAGSSRSLVVGREGTGGAAGGPPGSGGVHITESDASLAKALSAHIEQNHLTVSFVTVSCSDRCADVVAVATGGFEPYSFVWDDGSTNPSRQVCPTSTTNYRVTVKDTGSSSGEFTRDPEVAEAPLTANVLRCPADAGADSGDPGGHLRLTNPSFEGTPQLNLGFAGTQLFDAPPWQACDYTPDIIDQSVTSVSNPPRASDGKTYLGLGTGGAAESAIQSLCSPFRRGDVEHLLVDVAVSTGTGLTLQFYGSDAASCSGGAPDPGDDLLGGTAPIPDVAGVWTTECVTLQAHSDVSILKIAAGAGSGYLFVDNIRPVPSCL